MAGETSAARRAYEEIKKLILDGKLGVRTRIDVEGLARGLGLSSMPVRQALSLLTWERLVRAGQQAGYEVALWSERELMDLYEWRGVLLTMTPLPSASAMELARTVGALPYAQAVWDAMRAVEQGANAELRRAAQSADDRLHAARLVEAEVLGDVAGEFETLVGAFIERSRRLKSLINAYHRRRVQRAGALRERVVLRALPNNGAPD